MNQIYVLLGGIFWRAWKKRVVLWYAHGATSASLRLAETLAHAVVTSTPEGFRISSGKVRVVGQGIDTKRFTRRASGYRSELIRIFYAGRISPVKHCEVLITAAGILNARGERFFVTLVGDTGADPAYYASLQERIGALGLTDVVVFTGGVAHDVLPEYLWAADMFVNASATGSLDKAGLEGLVSGLPLVTCNPAFKHILGAYADRLMFPEGDAALLAERILELHRAPDRQDIVAALAEKVRTEHSLEKLIPRILGIVSKNI
ncbi:glycosyltransferase [Candidatus Kaiserbacteria bacterium]|nr:glycosyltransferase [Candidatus Kaiserbacteria bacterium]